VIVVCFIFKSSIPNYGFGSKWGSSIYPLSSSSSSSTSPADQLAPLTNLDADSGQSADSSSTGSGSSDGHQSSISPPLDSSANSVTSPSDPPPPPGSRANATFVTLARNHDVWEIAKSIRAVEDRFNRNFHYDWVFLNDQPFDDTFKKITSALVSGNTHYGLIPPEHWSYPSWIDQAKAAEVRKDMHNRKIIYGDSESYRHMCRFESGFFFRHPLLLNYQFYWRVEPSIVLYCDLPFDPFAYMRDHNKKYAFVLSLYEYIDTIPHLWDAVLRFITAHPEHIASDNSLGFLSDDGGKTYNKCHFVSLPLFPPLSCPPSLPLSNNHSGQTLKSAAWTGCGPTPISTTSTS
jgi:alpha 1,2-mannosyltransferase